MPTDLSFVAFLVTALGAVSAFLAWLIKDTLADVRKQRDAALDGWKSQTEVTDKLSEALRQRNVLDEQMLALLKEGS